MPRFIIEVELPFEPANGNYLPEEVMADLQSVVEQQLQIHYPHSGKPEVVCRKVNEPMFVS